MRPILQKVYGYFQPIHIQSYKLILLSLNNWHCHNASTWENNFVSFSYEGDYFPCDEITQILKENQNELTKGKLDCINIEEWTLTRHFFTNKNYKTNTASLNKALENTMM